VLSQGASLAAIQPHLKKLFAGIHRVRCGQMMSLGYATCTHNPHPKQAELLLCLPSPASKKRPPQVRTSPDAASITAMVSGHGEVVPLPAPVVPSEAVEAWLHDLAHGMRGALQASLAGVAALPDPFATAPVQVSVVCAQGGSTRVCGGLSSLTLGSRASLLNQLTR
jgi:hypothetical protein